MTTPSNGRYEFDETQNATIAKLARAMTFVAVTMLLLSASVGFTAVMMGRSTLAAAAVLAPLAIAIGVMGAQQFAASRRFRRIVLTRGNDINNLMSALDDLVVAYGVQRWLWLTVLVSIVLALAFTGVAR